MFSGKNLHTPALTRLPSFSSIKVITSSLSHCLRGFSDQHSSRLNCFSLTNHNPFSSAFESLHSIKHNHFSRAYATGLTGQFKTYKPRTPGLRWLKRPNNDHLWKGKPVRRLTVAKRATGGRNHHGHITVRHRGGGHKRRIRLVDFFRWDEEPSVVERIEYDPNRSAHIALLMNQITRKQSYIIAPHDFPPGTIVRSFRKSSQESTDSSITRVVAAEKGNCMPLKMIPVGTLIHCISLKPNGPGILCRSAGCSAQLIRTGDKGYAQVRLSSGETRLIHVDCCATIGALSNPDHQHRMLGKAGRSRWLGIRPTVRGVAMNACDHPHGGGRGKSKGNRHPCSPTGVLAKGGKTRKRPNRWVVKPRPRR